MDQRAVIDGYNVHCSPEGTLWVVKPPNGPSISVLTRGTHAALDVVGKTTKKKIVRWWKKARAS